MKGFALMSHLLLINKTGGTKVRLFKKTLMLVVAFLLLFSTNIMGIHIFAEQISSPQNTVIENDFVKVTVDNSTGRFGIRTVEGQPIRKNDQNVNMLFGGDDPETSFTTFRIDGTDYIFGNPYKFGVNFLSEITPPRIVRHPDGSQHIETIWTIKDVQIRQIVMLYGSDADAANAGNVNIRYDVVNNSTTKVELGTRILLDTMVASNDGPAFQIGTAFRAPLSVERKLVHDPRAEFGIPEEDVNYYKLPPYWVMRDTLDLTNPLATNVIAYGFNNFSEQGINIVDEMIVGHWNGLANTKWDYDINPNLDFTRDTNDYGTADAAVAFYWNPKEIQSGASKSFETVYGLGELIEPDKVFSIRYIDPVQQLATNTDSSGYENEGIFDIIAEVENLALFNMEHSHIDLELTLQSGLNFVRLDEAGNIVRDGTGKALTESARSKSLRFQKSATPEEADLGIEPKYKPGETVTVSFKVQAQGRPWPATREYMLKARSPETQAEIEGVEDESIKAQYEASQTNFVLLPPIGEAMPTYVYGVSPKELYVSDVKYITLNLSNIEAYNPGNKDVSSNFDLYLVEKLTGQRFKVPVRDSVIIQPGADGLTGDMRITYRGGDLVDNVGNVIEANLGPSLPLGEYQVEIDFKEDLGGDEEMEAMYDITTKQTILVTDNEETRVRQANILAVFKQTVDLTGIGLIGTPGTVNETERLETVNSAFPGEPFQDAAEIANSVIGLKASRTLIGTQSRIYDSGFDLAEFLNEGVYEEYSLYHYETFETEEELEEFFKDEDDGREMILDIRGMIKEVGTGEEQQIVIDTKTEPAIINGAVAYKGKDMVFVRGNLDIFGRHRSPFLETLTVRGDGTLNVANSGFVFHKGQWTIDFFNGFDKSVSDEPDEDGDEQFQIFPESDEDDSLNGSLKWAIGNLTDRVSPIRQVMIEHVYFNQHSLFATPSFAIGGFNFSFNDYILRNGGISFGGTISMKIIEGEIQNVVFNNKGFVGVDASLKFELDSSLGLFSPKKGGDGADIGGGIDITHYVQNVGKTNRYGIHFQAAIVNQFEIQAQLAFKQVADGRVLPDVIAFGLKLPPPGVPIVPGVLDVSGLRGAVKELADTIAGGTSKDPFPLILQAGITARVGAPGVYFYGDIDLTVKRTGLALLGKLDLSVDGGKNLIPILSSALVQTQWVTPWFVRAEAELDIMGWEVIIGKAGIFIGQNLEKNRTDFEGYIGAKVQIPPSVPVVGGIPLASVFFGVNNDKIWGSVSILLISLGMTYYWGGGIEFGTSLDELPDGLIHMVVEDPENGPQLIVIGHGMETLATSWVNAEKDTQEITYRQVADGVSVIDTGSMHVGMGGIKVEQAGKVHKIPMDGVSGNALIEVEYDGAELPHLTVTNDRGALYPLVFDNTNTNPNANAFTQFIPANAEGNTEQVDIRKAYIIVPADKVNGGTWTITSSSAVETKLLNVPTTPELKDVTLKNKMLNKNAFTAEWTVENAEAGDTINLYLTEDTLASGEVTTLENGEEVLETGDPGLLVAKDVPVGKNGSKTGALTKGSLDIDVTQVELLGDVEDIRGLLSQGDYYLRAELKSSSAFGTKTSKDTFKLINPHAPDAVSNVTIEPAGNGYFNLSFKPAAKKASQAEHEHTYVIEAFKDNNGKLEAYLNYAEVMLTEEELAPYWNEDKKKYENIPIGGWTEMTTAETIVDLESLDGMVMNLQEEEDGNTYYVGLEIGHEYVIGVSSVIIHEVEDKEKFHFAERVYSNNKKEELLPIPVKPKLSATSEFRALAEERPFIEVLTNQTKQTIRLSSDQENVVVEALYGDEIIAEIELDNKESGGSSGTLSFDQFDTDGPYAIELIARNKVSKDLSITMLYLTVDTLAPVLYLDEPITGARTENGAIRVAGTTTNDVSSVFVNGMEIDVAEDGTFNGTVNVYSSEPTIDLQIIARDHAGNQNSATVVVSNDQFDVPAGIGIRQISSMEPGESEKIEVFLRVLDGTNEDGSSKFKNVPLTEKEKERISLSISKGEAVRLDETNTITAVQAGASLIVAEYEVAEGVTLEAMAVASVENPEINELGTVSAYTTAVSGNTTMTKVVVGAAGDMVGHQLVYKVFPKGTSVTLPVFKEKLDTWTLLPSNGEIPANAGDTVVVAKITSGAHEAIALSGLLTANVWSSGGAIGGGGGGGPMLPLPVPPVFPAPPLEVTVGDRPIETEWKDDILVTKITEKDITTDTKDIVVRSKDKSVKQYQFNFEKKVREQAIKENKNIILELPLARIVITPKMMAGNNEDIQINIAPNSNEAAAGAKEIATTVNATLLGEGQGISLETNLFTNKRNQYVQMSVPVPDNILANDITAIVLKDKNGNWTTIPWKMEFEGNTPFVHLQLSGEGNISFIQNSQSFSDVSETFWGKQSISDASSRLYVLGKGNGVFDPNSQVTRAEYPTILLRVAGFMNKEANGAFSDVAADSWYNRSVAIASEMGIVNGYQNGTYVPNASLSRVEGMTMVGRLLETLDLTNEITDAEIEVILRSFDDGATVPAWARKATALTIKHGIILGENNNINPQNTLTRAQAAAIAVRIERLLTEY